MSLKYDVLNDNVNSLLHNRNHFQQSGLYSAYFLTELIITSVAIDLSDVPVQKKNIRIYLNNTSN